jgi:hypothetical protein
MTLAEHNRVQLLPSLRYRKFEGNEITEQLTKKGFEYPFTGPEPAYGLSESYVGNKKWINRKHQEHTVHNRIKICKRCSSGTSCLKS